MAMSQTVDLDDVEQAPTSSKPPESKPISSTPESPRPLAVISNALPEIDPEERKIKLMIGGLVTGIVACLKATSRVAKMVGVSDDGDGMADTGMTAGSKWLGWDGKRDDTVAALADRTTATLLQEGFEIVSMPKTEAEHKFHYIDFSNEVIWPTSHSRPQDVLQHGAESFEGYKATNKVFAEQFMQHITPEHVVWIQDYHLMTLGKEMRALGAKNDIFYFHHIPIPEPEVLEKLDPKTRGQMIECYEALFECDRVGFQTQKDLNNFAKLMGQPLPKEDLKIGETVTFERNGRKAQFEYTPIGIDVDAVQKMAAENAQGRPEIPMGFTSGRADPAKYVPEAMAGVEEALKDGLRFTFNMYVFDNRQDIEVYRKTSQTIRSETARINEELGTEGFQPIMHTTEKFNFASLVGMYRDARFCLINSFKDGSNLVAKEYQAAQDPNDPGVLIISRGAGAAEELAKVNGAIIIEDPGNKKEVAAAIKRALTMPLEERVAMNAAGVAVHRAFDAVAWSTECTKPIVRNDDTCAGEPKNCWCGYKPPRL